MNNNYPKVLPRANSRAFYTFLSLKKMTPEMLCHLPESEQYEFFNEYQTYKESTDLRSRILAEEKRVTEPFFSIRQMDSIKLLF